MKEISLYSGAGGGLYGGAMLGWKPVVYVEKEPYCQDIIKARIRDGIFTDAPIHDDVDTFDAKPYRGKVDIVTGGFP